MPLYDAVGALVLGADARNLDAVFVAGQPRKWNGQLVGVDVTELRGEVHASRDALQARIASAGTTMSSD